jgi:hypothetical protein
MSQEAAAAVAVKRQEEEVIIKRENEEAAAKNSVLGVTEGSKSKPPTRAQLLAKALRKCKKQPKKKRAQCVAAAKKKYASKTKGKGGRRSNVRSTARGYAVVGYSVAVDPQ